MPRPRRRSGPERSGPLTVGAAPGSWSAGRPGRGTAARKGGSGGRGRSAVQGGAAGGEDWLAKYGSGDPIFRDQITALFVIPHTLTR